MPFTLAHPAAVVPLRSRMTNTSALVIGSMAPDFEYFLRGRPVSTFSHSILGLLVFCLPMGLVVFYLVRSLSAGFVQLLPRFVQARLASSPTDAGIRVVVVSILIGAVTHDVWDSFTHRAGLLVRQFHLDRTVAGVPLFRILQHGSTVVGFVVLTTVAMRYLRKREPQQVATRFRHIRAGFWVLVVTVSVILVLISCRFATRRSERWSRSLPRSERRSATCLARIPPSPPSSGRARRPRFATWQTACERGTLAQMKDNRTDLQRFIDFARAIVKVPKKEVAAQPRATRPAKEIKRRPKA